nr:copine [Hymenolepis microstoma]
MDDELGTEVEISISCSYDVDDPIEPLRNQDFLGSCDATLGEIVSVGELEKNLTGVPQGNKGSIILIAEETVTCSDEITFSISAKNLDKKDIIGLSDPFLAFYRLHENGSVTVVHRTEVLKNTLNPSWNTMVLPVRLLCNGDLNRESQLNTSATTRSYKRHGGQYHSEMILENVLTEAKTFWPKENPAEAQSSVEKGTDHNDSITEAHLIEGNEVTFEILLMERTWLAYSRFLVQHPCRIEAVIDA